MGNQSNKLYHHGVKGMRWGIRRDRSKSTGTGLKRQSSKSEDYLRAKSLKKKSIKQLSNAELKELNNRMQLENQYKSLKKQRISTGRKFVQDVAYEAAKNTASEYARKYAKEGIKFVSDAIKSR